MGDAHVTGTDMDICSNAHTFIFYDVLKIELKP